MPKDSSSLKIAFKSAARLAYKAGMPLAKPILLEPIVKAEVTIPEEYTGTVIGDFNKRRGMILGMELNADNEQVVTAEAPMSEMMHYPWELRSFTQGRGTYSQKFDRYEAAPQQVADKVIAAAAKDKLHEDDDE